MATSVQETLERIERWQPHINAFSQVFADEALDQAKHPADGPLAGVPVAVKDLFDVTGHETTGCCAAYAGNVADRDADVVARLREAGAIVVGKTNQHELAFGTTNLISACGPVRNPWDLERIPGGSSGGSAAAVAAGIVPISLGTDTGGSIRIPSSFCGVFGLKPTHGRLSLDGVMPLAASLDCPGPIAATAGDLALAWKVLSGDATAARVATGIAVLHTDRCTDEVDEAVRATARALGELGATISEVPDAIKDAPEVWVDVAAPEMFRDHAALLDRPELVHQIVGAFLEYGRSQPSERLEAAREECARFTAWFEEQLAQADAVLMPATPYPAPRADEETIPMRSGELIDVHLGGASTFTRVVNLTGLPAVAIPAGRTPGGLPIGVQLVGRRGDEATLLQMARRLEEQGDRFRAREAPLPS